RLVYFVTPKSCRDGKKFKERRPSQLGDRLAKHKIDDARKLTPEQQLLLTLELSNATAPLQRACSNKHEPSFFPALKQPWHRSFFDHSVWLHLDK
ncbi:MAG TPA: hypothetical protein VLA60_15005, partial [Nitrospirales bacterium]|nr:hypothetical protein [Nitrospirales bacterium]